MRALSACLTVVLGLGVAAIAACSSTASDTGTGGTGGQATGGTSAGGASAGSSSAGKGGSAAAGTSSSAAGDTGSAGAAACSFESDACIACVASKCGTPVGACKGACGTALSNLDGCLCNSSSSPAECETKFITDGGDQGKAVADCFDANCKSVCE